MLDYYKDIKKIGGWLTKSEAIFLYNTAISLDGCPVVEIGSWKGKSTICLGLGSKNGKKVKIYAIDPHTGSSEHNRWYGKVDTYNEFLINIKENALTDLVVPIKFTSMEAVKLVNENNFGFIFVDGAHEYKYVKLDYELWFPKLNEGSFIAFHDCWHALGVHYLTAKLLITSKEIRNPKLIDTMTVFEKVKHNNIMDRFINVLFVIYRFAFGWIGTIKMDTTGTVEN